MGIKSRFLSCAASILLSLLTEISQRQRNVLCPSAEQGRNQQTKVEVCLYIRVDRNLGVRHVGPENYLVILFTHMLLVITFTNDTSFGLTGIG